MAVAVARVRPLGWGMPTNRVRRVLSASVFAGILVLALLISRRISPPSAFAAVGYVGFAGTVVWMFFSSRYAVTLGILVAYLGLLDGYLKLKTGSQVVTLGRDLLLYAIALGFLARKMLRHEPMPTVPLAGIVGAFVTLTLVQLANPGSGGLGHSIAALRPHLEFVPLFVLAYLTVTTKRRLFALTLILLIIGAANGAVSLIQFNLTPQQLSTWGPGYSDRIAGIGVSGRTFVDSNGVQRVRPFGLGSDSGSGGIAGLLALPSALALIGLIGRRREALIAIPLLVGIALAIITSQGRSVFIGTVVVLLAYVLLTVLSRRLVPTLAAIVVVVTVATLSTSALTDKSSNAGAFSRYATITPTKLLATTQEDRGGSIALAPTYAATYPFGAGLGLVGPGRSFESTDAGLNGETEFNFLIVEVGVVGALAFLAFVISLLKVSLTRIRPVRDPETRVLLAALAAPLFGMFALFFAGAPSAGSPSAPYLWGVGGVLMFWLRPRSGDAPTP